jgi:hypothetical protein
MTFARPTKEKETQKRKMKKKNTRHKCGKSKMQIN